MPIYAISGRNILFMHIPKTGGSAISHALSAEGTSLFNLTVHRDGRLLNPTHATRDLIDEFYNSSMFDACITVVRNPIDRMLSEYRYQRRKYGLHAANFLNFDTWLRMSLARFRHDPVYRDNHFRPQTDFITENCQVFRLENGLEQPLAYLERITGANLISKLVTKNASPRINVPCSAKSIAFIRDTYKDDFITFGYTR